MSTLIKLKAKLSELNASFPSCIDEKYRNSNNSFDADACSADRETYHHLIECVSAAIKHEETQAKIAEAMTLIN